MNSLKPTIDAVIAAYGRHGSVWKAGNELGVPGQTISQMMRDAGVPTNKRWVTEEDRSKIRYYYENTPQETFDVAELSRALGRSIITVTKVAGALGLTKKGRRRNDKTLERQKSVFKDQWKHKPHPRGMLGKKHSPEVLAKMSENSKKRWATWKAFGTGQMTELARKQKGERVSQSIALRASNRTFTRARGGFRPDLGQVFFRSSWEANYARYLNLLIKLGVVDSWEYEPETFWFNGVRRGTNSYKPDFKVRYRGDVKPEYIELKGWVQAKDRTKWRRMAKYHPEIKLIIVGAKEYNKLKAKWATSIPNWETIRGGGLKLGPRERTHCKRGHALEGANRLIATNGAHVCKQCVRDAERRYRERQRQRKTMGN